MPNCKNNPKKQYTGDEPSPKGLGYCASGETEGTEMKGKDVSDDEKEAAKAAREFVYKLVFNKFVRLENIESEKYGRILADVYIGDIHLNELLLKERYAVKYDGGTKKKPISWLKYKADGSGL